MLAIKIHNLNHYYGKNQALKDVNLELPKAKTIALIGPDGVGKSSLLSLIAGAKILQKGEIKVFDYDIASKKDRDILAYKIAFMPQGLGKNLYPTLSIYENIDFHARLFALPQKYKKERINRLLSATGLAPFANRAAGKLSGGMKQKLSLCCALVHSPELLILDEPTTGVDPLSRRQFWELVEDLRSEAENLTVIVATAYMDEAENFEHLIAMDNGKILANAPTLEIMRDFNSLEEAYISLLPEEKRGESNLIIPPLQSQGITVIEANNLTKKFGNFTAVNKVGFKIEKGEIFGFLGSNGCGKSTTMKMLTGLLEPTLGEAKILGKKIEAGGMEIRKKVGYMSQSFSLYEELTVKENLILHAKLYQIPKNLQSQFVENAMLQFELKDIANVLPSALPLGIKQRLQLAAACLHKPEILILDEPTSGVDVKARDMFWQYLIKLSREDKITIFVSTHFMNEAARCDRISFMHRGEVLAMGSPEELRKSKQASSLEEAFILYLEEQADEITNPIQKEHQSNFYYYKPKTGILAYFNTIYSFALREAKELLRDKVRMFFALCGGLIMLLTMASSISFDLNPAKLKIYDLDNSSLSRALAEEFRGSAYFIDRGYVHNPQDIGLELKKGEAKIVLEIPNNFGKNLLSGNKVQISILIDGAFPSLAENLKNSAQGVVNQFLKNLSRNPNQKTPSFIEARFSYNQDFKSIYAMTPSVIMLAMMLIPSMMTALGVVREKEIGSIMNLYGSPASITQFLIGKQIPYILLSFFSYLILVLAAIFVFEVPIKGSILAMFLGTLLAICASTAFGLLISSFVKTQIAGIFATAILMIMPTINFSGMLVPVANLDLNFQIMGKLFPGAWYQIISLGGFTKGLGFRDFIDNYLALIIIYLVYLSLAMLFLKKQEK